MATGAVGWRSLVVDFPSWTEADDARSNTALVEVLVHFSRIYRLKKLGNGNIMFIYF